MRWLFLRGLGLVYFSAFYPLVFQIRGLIGPAGLLPANVYLKEVAHALGALRYWYAPTLLWLSSSGRALEALCWVGMAASLLLVLNIWPRAMLAVCFIAFLSFVAAAQDFSGYQSDGMLLGAGFVGWFFAPRGLRPRWGEAQPPSRASLFLLQWLWFRIYFESGVAKFAGGDPEWRHLTAMDEYYQNGPLPTWIGWYVQHLPHWFHAATTLATLVLELLLVWVLFLPRRFRIAFFCIVTPWEIGIILTANYTFLNYLVMLLGVLLLDDRFLVSLLPRRWAIPVRENSQKRPPVGGQEAELVVLDLKREQGAGRGDAGSAAADFFPDWLSHARAWREAAGLWLAALMLSWVFSQSLFSFTWIASAWPSLGPEPAGLTRRIPGWPSFRRMSAGRTYKPGFEAQLWRVDCSLDFGAVATQNTPQRFPPITRPVRFQGGQHEATHLDFHGADSRCLRDIRSASSCPT